MPAVQNYDPVAQSLQGDREAVLQGYIWGKVLSSQKILGLAFGPATCCQRAPNFCAAAQATQNMLAVAFVQQETRTNTQ